MRLISFNVNSPEFYALMAISSMSSFLLTSRKKNDDKNPHKVHVAQTLALSHYKDASLQVVMFNVTEFS